MTTMASSLPPSSFQFVTFPVYISVNCSVVRSATSLLFSRMTAIPSIATMFSTAPLSFSPSSKPRDALPMSTLPCPSDSIPALDPVYSTVTVTPGFACIKLSLMASQSFSMDVLPAREILPVSSVPFPPAVSSGASDSEPPHAARLPSIIIAAMQTAAVFINFLFI